MKIDILDLKKTVEEMLLKVYPVGSIYMSLTETSPETLFGGKWETIEGTFLFAGAPASAQYAPGNTGGEFSHVLTINEMPSHTHTQQPHKHEGLRWFNSEVISGNEGGWAGYHVTLANQFRVGEDNAITTTTATALNNNSGGGQSHNNMPPYLCVYMWKRIQ